MWHLALRSPNSNPNPDPTPNPNPNQVGGVFVLNTAALLLRGDGWWEQALTLLPTASCPLPTACCLLPAAYCLQPAACSLQPAACRLPPLPFLPAAGCGLRAPLARILSSKVARKLPSGPFSIAFLIWPRIPLTVLICGDKKKSKTARR